jgi:hypothetical protein
MPFGHLSGTRSKVHGLDNFTQVCSSRFKGMNSGFGLHCLLLHDSLICIKGIKYLVGPHVLDDLARCRQAAYAQ